MPVETHNFFTKVNISKVMDQQTFLKRNKKISKKFPKKISHFPKKKFFFLVFDPDHFSYRIAF